MFNLLLKGLGVGFAIAALVGTIGILCINCAVFNAHLNLRKNGEDIPEIRDWRWGLSQ